MTLDLARLIGQEGLMGSGFLRAGVDPVAGSRLMGVGRGGGRAFWLSAPFPFFGGVFVVVVYIVVVGVVVEEGGGGGRQGVRGQKHG